MTEPSDTGHNTRVSRLIRAPRAAIYEAFLNPGSLATWLPPEGMTAEVHEFNPHEGGAFRLSLTYEAPGHSAPGKTSVDSDMIKGRFVELAPGERIVWRTTFESDDPGFAGEMTITWTFVAVENGTEVSVLCENIPAGVRPEDNAAGSRSSLEKLAAFVER